MIFAEDSPYPNGIIFVSKSMSHKIFIDMDSATLSFPEKQISKKNHHLKNLYHG